MHWMRVASVEQVPIVGDIPQQLVDVGLEPAQCIKVFVV